MDWHKPILLTDYSMRLLIIFILIAISPSVCAQKEKVVKLKSVRGEYSLVLEFSDVTGREATAKARENARKNAIEKVCGTRVSIWEQMEMSNGGDVFSSLSVNQIDGEIVEFKIIEEGHKQSSVRSSETIFYCIADVEVKKGLEPDPDFHVSVNDIKSVYYVGENLHFSVMPYKDCYMKIFLLEDNERGCMLYPNEYDGGQIMSANKYFNVSDSPYYCFEMQKSSDRQIEINRLVFVFTKTERPFAHKITSRAEIEKWIAKIPNNQKYLHFAVLEIRDK